MSYLTDDELSRFIADEKEGEKCARCRFWFPHEPPTWHLIEIINRSIVSYEGGCQRRAPKIVQLDGADEDCALWPTTKWNEWCGEYEPESESIFHAMEE